MSHKTNVLVDYLSFTVPAQPRYFDPKTFFPEYAELACASFLDKLWPNILGEVNSWKTAKSRPPYTTAIQRDRKFVLYAGVSQGHVLIEITGRGCQTLERAGILRDLIEKVEKRITRVDIAQDFETAIRPMQVHDDGFAARIKAVTTIISGSGETVYFGSAKSDKRCRVYRYNEPHERSHLLRFEYVYRKASARVIANRYLHEGLSVIAEASASTFGWKSKLFENVDPNNKIVNAPIERGSAKTLRWVYTQVAPAMRRLIEDKVIEQPEEFFKANFMP